MTVLTVWGHEQRRHWPARLHDRQRLRGDLRNDALPGRNLDLPCPAPLRLLSHRRSDPRRWTGDGQVRQLLRNYFRRRTTWHGRGFQARLHRRPMEENRGLRLFPIATTAAVQSRRRSSTKRATSTARQRADTLAAADTAALCGSLPQKRTASGPTRCCTSSAPTPASSPRVSLWTQRATCSARL